ncbi:MAG: hypothetical protein KDA24_13350, partial [Deltaproteobacteria bacterium]|nr:hypothetical protein [Deltaproteobacteria bacterium]
ALKNLRTVAIQQDPAVAILDGQSIPSVTLRALVVDPLDPDLEKTTHEWVLDLGDDFEEAEQLEGLIPEGPWTNEIQLDFSVLLGGGGAPPGGGPPGDGGGERDSIEAPAFLPVEYNSGLLPLSYNVENDERLRESIKFVNFLVPDFENLPLPPTVPGTRPQQAYEEALAAAAEAGPPEAWNANPNLTKITINEGEQVFEGEQITEHLTVIDIGTVAPGEGIRFDIEVADDKAAVESDGALYWTHGTPGLPVDEDDDDGGFGGFGGGDEVSECYEPKEGDPEAQDGEGFGGGADLSEAFQPERAFGWTAPCSVMNGPVRLYIIVTDGEGGVAWQEMRVRVE